MTPEFKTAHVAGFECLTAWSDLLDRINVFPVADGDTGRNLIVSLSPLRSLDNDPEKTIHRLMLQARGNSGNIAARFFAGFLTADSGEHLSRAARDGRDLACQAVYNPLPGTMLTVFDALVEHLEAHDFTSNSGYAAGLMTRLEAAVKHTPDLLPRLKSAGVVDAGALGMFIFFSGFFSNLAGATAGMVPVTETFKGQLQVGSAFRENHAEGHCVDTIIRLEEADPEKIAAFSECGESVVMISHKDYVKVHFHTRDARAAEDRIKSFGEIVKWSADDIAAQAASFGKAQAPSPVHIMTDAAGSLTREDARRLNITLLDSYITAGEESLPETRFPASQLYRAMRRGIKVSTSQASVFERHQHYRRVVQQYQRVLYLCVGSVFTGNYGVAMEWKQKNDPEDRLTVMDTAAASGRLGTIALATARFAAESDDFEAVLEFAGNAVDQCKEYVFLDKLKYLAAGGRLSKSGAFLGDIFHAKPIISPVAEGARKVGMVKNRKEQLAFALDRLGERFTEDSAPFIMLEYSDNFEWVNETVWKQVAALLPLAEIRMQPLSLTSGAHMGPGTWGVAFLE
ncbi:MAG: DegV family protein [Thermodesulfobacteriota bacterium]